MRAGLDAQQAVQQVVALPRPEAQVPGMDVAPRTTAARPEDAGAMAGRQRERPLELRALEVLRAVTLHDAQRAGVGGQRGGIGEDAVHHEPFVGAERREALLRQAALERSARLLHYDTGGRQGTRGLAGGVRGKLDHTYTARLERGAHHARQALQPRDGELLRVLGDGTETAVRPAPADRRSHVRADDRRHPGVPHDPPLLDAVEKTHRRRLERAGAGQRVDSQVLILHRIGAGELLHVAPSDTRLRHAGRGHRARGEDRLDPRAGGRHRVRSAQPRYVTLRLSVSTLPPPSGARSTPFISCTTIPFRARPSFSSAGVMKRRKSWKPSGMVWRTYSSSQMSCRNAALVRLCVRKPSPPPGASTAATPASVRSRSSTCSSTSTANTRSNVPSSPAAVRSSAVPRR